MRRHALALAHQRQQYVLGADVVLLEVARLAHALFEHFLGARRVDHRPDRRIVVAAAEDLYNLLPRGVERNALEHHAAAPGSLSTPRSRCSVPTYVLPSCAASRCAVKSARWPRSVNFAK